MVDNHNLKQIFLQIKIIFRTKLQHFFIFLGKPTVLQKKKFFYKVNLFLKLKALLLLTSNKLNRNKIKDKSNKKFKKSKTKQNPPPKKQQQQHNNKKHRKVTCFSNFSFVTVISVISHIQYCVQNVISQSEMETASISNTL